MLYRRSQLPPVHCPSMLISQKPHFPTAPNPGKRPKTLDYHVPSAKIDADQCKKLKHLTHNQSVFFSLAI